MLPLLPVSFLVLATLLMRTLSGPLKLTGRREAFIAGSFLTGLAFAVGTGALSLFQAIHLKGIVTFWILLCLIAGSTLFLRRARLTVSTPLPQPPLTLTEKIMIACLIALAVTLFLLAAAIPPNSWDAMVYHMSRVAHWVHNRNVAHFATPITRELWAMPLAEYIILHLQILSNSDQWANCVQWFGWVGSSIGVSLIAKMMGASRKGQIAAALFAATIPMSVLQATSTKNDLPTAFWLASAIWAFLKWLKEGQKPVHVLLAATAVALAAFTKGSSYLFLPPFLALTLFLAPKNGKKITLLFVGLFLGMILLTGFFHVRNRLDFGTWNPAKNDVLLQNERMSVPLFISNLIRHSAVHLQTPSQRINNVFIKIVRGSYEKLGIDFFDPPITHHLREDVFLQVSTAYNEYYAGNFLHFFLGIFCCVVGMFWKRNDRGLLRLYILAILAAYATFVLYMKWQPWISRLHLPLFILGTPVLAIVLERFGQKQRVLVAIALICAIATGPWILKDRMRPLIGKKTIFNTSHAQKYFLDRGYMYEPFTRVAGVVNEADCRNVGLLIQDDCWEYPYWALLENKDAPVDIRHLNVPNPSRRHEDFSWQPCAIIRESPAEEKAPIYLRGRTYVWQEYTDPLNVYLDQNLITIKAKKNIPEQPAKPYR